jgi:hypothetical protein
LDESPGIKTNRTGQNANIINEIWTYIFEGRG